MSTHTCPGLPACLICLAVAQLRAREPEKKKPEFVQPHVWRRPRPRP